MPSTKPKIKITLRRNRNPIQTSTTSSQNGTHYLYVEDLSATQYHNLSNIKITRCLLQNKLHVAGSKLECINKLRKHLHNLPPLIQEHIKTPTNLLKSKQLIYKFMVNSVLKLLGNTNHVKECVNEDDISTA